jgi:Trk-type K+ transport system membrane component
MEMKSREWTVLLWIIAIVASAIRMVVHLIAFTWATETLFTFFIVLFLFFLPRFVTQSGALNVTISALALGGAIYVRSIAYYLPAIVTLIVSLVDAAFPLWCADETQGALFER